MAIRQFLITVTVKAKGISIVDGTEVEFEQPHNIEIDLVRDSVAEFLSMIHDDINGHSALSVAITRPDGETLGYHDGMLPESDGYGWGPWQRTSERGERNIEGRREATRLYARALLHIKEAEEQAKTVERVDPV